MGCITLLLLAVLAPWAAAEEPFFSTGKSLEIIGIYNTLPEDFPSLKELGINSVVLDSTELTENGKCGELSETLGRARENGLKVILGLFKRSEKEGQEFSFDSYAAQTYLRACAQEEAIHYWYLADRADTRPQMDPVTINLLNNLVHLGDPKKRPTVITLSDEPYAGDSERKNLYDRAYKSYKEHTDIVGVVRLTSHKETKSHLDKYVYPELKEKRWWGVVSLRQSPESLKKTIKHFVDAGASGILYHAYHDSHSGFDLAKQERLKTTLKEIHLDFIAAAPAPQAAPANPGQAAAPVSPAGPAPSTLGAPPSTFRPPQPSQLPGVMAPQTTPTPQQAPLSPQGLTPEQIQSQRMMEQMRQQSQQKPE